MGLFKSHKTKVLENLVIAHYISNTVDSFDLDEQLQCLGVSDEEWSDFCNRFIKERAYAGDVECQVLYGTWQEGKNNSEAISFLEKAANCGNVHAMESLAHGYCEYGRLNTDRSKELYWRAKAADAGSISSMITMAREYMIGEGVEKNYDIAENYLMKASNLGSGEAYKTLADLPKYNNTESRIHIFKNVFRCRDLDKDTVTSTFIGLASIYNLKDTPYYNPHKAKYCYFRAGMEDPVDNIVGWYKAVEYEPTEQEFEQWKSDHRNHQLNTSLL